jgi:hypothetical protein
VWLVVVSQTSGTKHRCPPNSDNNDLFTMQDITAVETFPPARTGRRPSRCGRPPGTQWRLTGRRDDPDTDQDDAVLGERADASVGYGNALFASDSDTQAQHRRHTQTELFAHTAKDGLDHAARSNRPPRRLPLGVTRRAINTLRHR